MFDFVSSPTITTPSDSFHMSSVSSISLEERPSHEHLTIVIPQTTHQEEPARHLHFPPEIAANSLHNDLSTQTCMESMRAKPLLYAGLGCLSMLGIISIVFLIIVFIPIFSSH